VDNTANVHGTEAPLIGRSVAQMGNSHAIAWQLGPLLAIGALVVAGCSAAPGPPLPASVGGPNSGARCPSGTTVHGAAPPRGKIVYCAKPGTHSRKDRVGPVVSWSCSRCKEGRSLHGHYILGERDGVWTLLRKNGSKIDEGQWREGKRFGKWQGWYANGTARFMKTYDDNGRKTGPAWLNSEEGHRAWEGEWLRNVKHGRWKTFRKDGKPATDGHYRQGIKHGEWKLYDANGELDKYVWYDGGNLVREGKLVDGQLRISSLNDKGQKTATWSDRDGKRHGVYVAYFPGTEIVKRKTMYDMGVKKGPVSIHRKDGTKMVEATQVDGKVQCGLRFFDTAGKDISRVTVFAKLLGSKAIAAGMTLPGDPCAWDVAEAMTLREGADEALSIAVVRWLLEARVARSYAGKVIMAPPGNDARLKASRQLVTEADAALAKLEYNVAALLHLAALVEADRAHGGTLLDLPGTHQLMGSPSYPGPVADAKTKAAFKAMAKGQLASMSTILNEREKGVQSVRKAGRITLGKVGLNKLTMISFRKKLQ